MCWIARYFEVFPVLWPTKQQERGQGRTEMRSLVPGRMTQW